MRKIEKSTNHIYNVLPLSIFISIRLCFYNITLAFPSDFVLVRTGICLHFLRVIVLLLIGRYAEFARHKGIHLQILEVWFGGSRSSG